MAGLTAQPQTEFAARFWISNGYFTFRFDDIAVDLKQLLPGRRST